MNWTHLLQSERHAQYFDGFVCSKVFKVIKITCLFNIKCFLYNFHTFVFSGKKPNQLVLVKYSIFYLYLMTSLMINLKY